MRTASLVVIGILTPAVSWAHLELTSPTSRYGGDVLKAGPCGMMGGARSQNVFTFNAGETITVSWNEYIDHPGHYRISFDDDGDDDFLDPQCTANCATANPTIETYDNPTVLLDGIQDRVGGDYSVDVTLPDVACDKCTLQVIQIMTDKPPYTIPGNDLYYQCVDLILLEALTPDAGPGDTKRDDGGCVCAGAPPAGLTPPALAFLVIAGAARSGAGRARRRRRD